jgi:hypothetical protein
LSGRNIRDMERFSAEAVLLAELTHPGIVRYGFDSRRFVQR